MLKKIVLGGGCFWGMQELFRAQEGIVNTRVGYAGGSEPSPTYENHTGHAEVVEIAYDSDKTSFKKILDYFFRIHDPTTLNQQGNDMGTSYRSVIFYNSEEERTEAVNFINLVNISHRWERPVVTSLEPLAMFTEAEGYHQDYLQKNPSGYTCHFIRGGSYLDIV